MVQIELPLKPDSDEILMKALINPSPSLVGSFILIGLKLMNKLSGAAGASKC